MPKEQEEPQATESTDGQSGSESTEGQDEGKKTESESAVTLTQPEIDKKVGEAVFKALENERKKQDKVLLEKEGKHKELAEQLQAELDAVRAKESKAIFDAQVMKAASDSGLTDIVDVLSELPNEKTLNLAVDKLNSVIDAQVEARVNARLENKSPASSTASFVTKPSSELTSEEWAVRRKELNIR